MLFRSEGGGWGEGERSMDGERGDGGRERGMDGEKETRDEDRVRGGYMRTNKVTPPPRLVGMEGLGLNII